MDITINFGSCALRYEGPALVWSGVYVWNGDAWVPWENGSPEEKRSVARLVRASALAKTMPEKMRRAVLGE